MLGETWVNHWGGHGSQSTRGIIAKGQEKNPILRGIKDGDVWGPTDVYEAYPPSDCTPLVLGQVLKGMKPTDEPLEGKKNEPMMPIAWTKNYSVKEGKTGRAFSSTIGASHGLRHRGDAAADRQRLLLGGGAGGQDSREDQRGPRRQVRADSVPGRRTQEGRQAVGPRGGEVIFLSRLPLGGVRQRAEGGG